MVKMNEKVILKLSAVVSAMAGVIILFTTLYPIVSYEADAGRKYPSLISPIGQKDTLSEASTSVSTGLTGGIDYTDPSNWFVGTEYDLNTSPSLISHYTISIPKLDIEDAIVEVGGKSLEKSLIQYPGTASPGKAGNAVIFGHSILPQFYNPKNYLAVFSLLPTLDKGDSIQVKYDGVAYSYIVEDMFEVLPTDLQILDQQPDSSYLTLVTCVPPGHPLKPKRLIVRARVASYNQGLYIENNL